MGYQTGKFALGSILCALIPHRSSELLSEYLYHYLDMMKEILFVPLMKGVANVSLPIKRIANVEIPLPSIDKQKVVVEILKKYKDVSRRIDDESCRQKTLLKKYRQAILQEAIQGKLTADWRKAHPDVEPASELLKRIAAEKAELVKAKKIRRQKPLPPITDDEIPFEIPETWAWCRVGDVAELITSGSRGWAKYYSESGAIFLTMGNLSKGNYDLRLDTIRYVNPPDEGEGKRTKLQDGDLLISITGDVGNLGLVPPGFGEAYINQHTCLLRFLPLCRGRYLPEFMRTTHARNQFNSPQRGIKNSFRLTDVGHMTFPLPPLAEQKIIAKRVQAKLALCDKLEAEITAAEQHAKQLSAAILQEVFDRQE